MNHPNLSAEINEAMTKSEIEGGVWVLDHPDFVLAEIKAQPVLPVGSTLEVQTRNTLYTIKKTGPKTFTFQGHPKYCPEPVEGSIAGSTFGGSMLKMGYIGRGMHLEFNLKGSVGLLVTSQILDIKEVQ